MNRKESKIKSLIKWIPLLLLLAFTLDYVQFGICLPNYGVNYNGFGSIESVIKGDAFDPTQYRVLVPAMYFVLKGIIPCSTTLHKIVWVYEPLKMFLVFCAIFAFFLFLKQFFTQFWALLGVALFCSCISLTFRYDYAGQWAELAIFAMGFIAILKNKQKHVLLWTILGVLNRETAFIIPILNFLINRKKGYHWIWSVLFYGMIFVVIRRIFPLAERFDLWVMFNLNLGRIGMLFSYPVMFGKTWIYSPYFNPVWFIVPMVGFWLYWALKNFKKKPDFFKIAIWLIPAFYFIGFIFTCQDEIRIFSWFYLVLIPMSLWSWRETIESKQSGSYKTSTI